MTDKQSDAEFTNRVLTQLPAVASSPGFEAALLAGYEDWRGRRSAGFLAALRQVMHGFANLVWPGAPVWAPASAFAVALLLGIGLGTLLPDTGERQMAFSLEQTPGFTLLSADGGEDL